MCRIWSSHPWFYCMHFFWCRSPCCAATHHRCVPGDSWMVGERCWWQGAFLLRSRGPGASCPPESRCCQEKLPAKKGHQSDYHGAPHHAGNPDAGSCCPTGGIKECHFQGPFCHSCARSGQAHAYYVKGPSSVLPTSLQPPVLLRPLQSWLALPPRRKPSLYPLQKKARKVVGYKQIQLWRLPSQATSWRPSAGKARLWQH